MRFVLYWIEPHAEYEGEYEEEEGGGNIGLSDTNDVMLPDQEAIFDLITFDIQQVSFIGHTNYSLQ